MTGQEQYPNSLEAAEALLNQDMTVYTLEEAQGIELRPGDVITGLRLADDYNQLERIAARQIVPSYEDTTATFAREPLGSMMRPPKFNGPLWGTAVIVPTDLQDLQRRRGRGTLPLQQSQALSLVVSADMYTSGKKTPIGVSTREAIYYLRTSAPDPDHDPVARWFGRRDTIKSVTELARLNHEASVARAERLAWFALRHTVLVRRRD